MAGPAQSALPPHPPACLPSLRLHRCLHWRNWIHLPRIGLSQSGTHSLRPLRRRPKAESLQPLPSGSRPHCERRRALRGAFRGNVASRLGSGLAGRTAGPAVRPGCKVGFETTGAGPDLLARPRPCPTTFACAFALVCAFPPFQGFPLSLSGVAPSAVLATGARSLHSHLSSRPTSWPPILAPRPWRPARDQAGDSPTFSPFALLAFWATNGYEMPSAEPHNRSPQRRSVEGIDA